VLTVKDIGELELKLTGGDHCTRANVDRSVAILFHCNQAAGLGSPRFIEEDDGVCRSSLFVEIGNSERPQHDFLSLIDLTAVSVHFRVGHRLRLPPELPFNSTLGATGLHGD